MPTPPTARTLLNKIGIDTICERIEGGLSRRLIAAEFGISKTALIEWLADIDHPDRSARARGSDKLSAEEFEALALEVLQRGQRIEGLTSPQAQLIREESQRYAKMAAVRDPQRYGDKIEQRHTNPDGSGPPVFQVLIAAPDTTQK